MDFLTIAGLVIPVADGSWKENAPTQGGSESYSYNGRLRSTVRWEKRSWSFSTAHMLKSEGEALKAACALGIPVAIGGTASTATPCRVKVGAGTVINGESEDDNNWMMVYDVTMLEV
jgi:hypothetical protein